MEENLREHKILMSDRKRLTVTAVEDVESFDEERVVIISDAGAVTVTGADFKISKLNIDDGQLEIEGEIDEIKYSDTVKETSQGGFFGKIFR